VRGHERSAFVALSRVAVGPGLDTASFEIPGTPSPPHPSIALADLAEDLGCDLPTSLGTFSDTSVIASETFNQ